jgi:hypothetical protein
MIALAALKALAATGRFQRVFVLARKTAHGPAPTVSLLGTPPPTAYFRDYQFVYWLGPERGFMSIDSEWLAIRFDRNGKVMEARIVRD